jgi:hypothetical protein
LWALLWALFQNTLKICLCRSLRLSRKFPLRYAKTGTIFFSFRLGHGTALSGSRLQTFWVIVQVSFVRVVDPCSLECEILSRNNRNICHTAKKSNCQQPNALCVQARFVILNWIMLYFIYSWHKSVFKINLST